MEKPFVPADDESGHEHPLSEVRQLIEIKLNEFFSNKTTD
jgi:hypothetical protein